MRESGLQKWGEYLSRPEVCMAIIGAMFSLGVIYDGITSGVSDVKAEAANDTKRIDSMEPRLARIEQKVDDIGIFLGVQRH